MSTEPRNREQDCIDAIDALVDESLERGPRDDYHKPYVARCSLCGASWHGLETEWCPGAYATQDQKDAFIAKTFTPRTHAPWLIGGWTLEDVHALRNRMWDTRTHSPAPELDVMPMPHVDSPAELPRGLGTLDAGAWWIINDYAYLWTGDGWHIRSLGIHVDFSSWADRAYVWGYRLGSCIRRALLRVYTRHH